MEKKPKKEVIIKNGECTKYKYAQEYVVDDLFLAHTIEGKDVDYMSYIDKNPLRLVILPIGGKEGLGDKDGEIPLKKGQRIKVSVELI